MRFQRVLIAIAVAAAAALPAVIVRVTTEPGVVGATTNRLNIVLVYTDDQTLDAFGSTPMPYLNAQHLGRWPNAESENHLCCPARAAKMSGQYDVHNGVMNNATTLRFDLANTVYGAMHSAGYHVGFWGKVFNTWPRGHGLERVPGTDYSWVLYGDPQYYRGFDYDADMNGKRQHYGKAAKDYSTDVMAGQAASFVRHAPADKAGVSRLKPCDDAPAVGARSSR